MDEDNLRAWAEQYPDSRLATVMRREAIASTLVSQMNAVGSNVSCRKCGVPNPMIWQRQTRSADESMTVFYLCKNSTCGNRWRE